HLHVELARNRLMRISLKREEWGLFDYPGVEKMSADIDSARQLFVKALQHQDQPVEAAKFADESLAISLRAAEELARFHASVFLARRQKSGGLPRRFLGVGAPQREPTPEIMKQLRSTFGFVRLPTVWREIQPKEQSVTYARQDAWVKACSAAKIPIRGGPLLHFGVRSVPDWMYIWENDYDTILDYAREHVRRTIKRFAGKITSWDVVSGLHASNVFDFTVEQIIDLTRMAAGLAKQLAPRSQVILDLTQPWGEYYARNQRTIPPLLYADMVVQSGVSFDAFGLEFLFGHDGYHVRDLFKISSLIDRLANLGKPLHVSALAVPSGNGAIQPSGGGQWHAPWSDEIQSEFVIAFLEVALSKPYVESVCLADLTDGPDLIIPTGGVLRDNLTPKAIIAKLNEFSKHVK
ncbi:MAG: endo-1,4-beta-xylanase, partial [Planctomycetes bacterium]|nr:endo-1,4-beta-xylanase [Planctomycetota bacterium]